MNDVDAELLEAAGVTHIPETLAARERWMVWNDDDGRKIPRAPWDRPLDYGANTQDPSLWVDLATALEHAARDDVDGLAYVLASTDPEHDHADDLPEPEHALVDFDNVRDPETGEHHPIIDRILDDAGTYAQVSTSGTGYHFIGQARLPDGVKVVDKEISTYKGFDDSHVEIYDNGRYIAFTGNHVDGTPEDTNDVQALVEEIASAGGDESGDGESEDRAPRKSREELADVDTTHDMDDVLDAIDHVKPGDIRLRSSVTTKRADGTADLDPSWASSDSGTRLAQLSDGWVYRKGMIGLDALQVVALEEHIITSESDYPSGEAWWEAVDALRERGAHIPEYVPGDLPEEEVKDRGRLTDEDEWEIFAQARQNGTLDETAEVTIGALRHIAREQNLYDFEELPEDVTELPDKAYNRALWWVEERWPEEASLVLDDDEDVTARTPRARDPERVFTWEDVRYVYDAEKREGRLAAVSYLRSQYEFLTPEDTEDLHVYDPELGIFDDTLSLGREMDIHLDTHYDQHEKREILGRLKEKTVDRAALEAGEYDREYVCVENGVLDVETGELHDHAPAYKFTTYLPVEYDPDAVPENTLRFLRDITTRNEDVRTLLEVLGHTLLSDYDDEWKHLFLVLFGEGSNGKSTWFDVVRTFLNGNREARNVESMTLQQITDNRFAASNLVGSWANVGEDLPQKKLADLGKLKDLTGGGETWVEAKGEPGFSYYNRATMMFGANRPPVLGERSTAIKRRLVPVHLPYEFVANPDPDDRYQKKAESGLIDELTTDEELSGLLNAALAGVGRLREQEDVSLPETREERLELYERHSDHIKAFRVDCLTNADGAQVSKDDVYNAYTNYCNEQDYAQVARSTFWRQVRQTTLTVSEKRLPEQPDGSRPRVLDGVEFKPDGEAYAPGDYGAPADGETDAPDRDVTPLADVEPGRHTLEVEVSAEFDPRPWLQAEGEFVDESGAVVDYVARGTSNPATALSEGGRYRIDAAKVETDEDGLERVRITDSSEITRLDESPPQSGLDESGGGESTDAAADGGEAVQVKERIADAIPKEFTAGDTVSVGRLSSVTDAHPEAVRDAVESIASEQRGPTLEPNGQGGYELVE
ncbi:hypothetical protein EFA46_016010 (plasmid) [Halarchaeum sp. CBA1220]|uniref:phage/plasmid primase, P4 family n=1 Tax=Halarchaeum sp. CBA1220 TaxID=1853682 RepID=UPI0015A49925|nr:phage/plasmid primase, P4 family [Halarchaeum sp. CBA1220]QLC35762.1 hypothetical protein EFA46_016010 [Halarchaeum sp. CBA1220]